jgi:N-acetylglucosaminyl-diphospho-decaprenol L-rhamnosyltransferase
MLLEKKPPALPTLQDLTVIVVTFNSAHCLPDLGVSLREFPRVVFVDNHSDDQTISEITQHLPQANIICNEQNLGFGAANNLGLNSAKTPFCLLLNPDCQINTQSALKLLETANAFPEAALIAPQLLRSNLTPEINYRWVNTRWSSRGKGAQGICCVGFACGAAWLLNMHAMKDVGFFDETFFLYYEDDDLCHRIFDRQKAILIDPSVKLIHSSRGSVKGNNPLRSEYIRGFHHAQSKIRFAQKYQSNAKSMSLRIWVLLGALLTLPIRLIAFSPRHLARLIGRIVGLCRITAQL